MELLVGLNTVLIIKRTLQVSMHIRRYKAIFKVGNFLCKHGWNHCFLRDYCATHRLLRKGSTMAVNAGVTLKAKNCFFRRY